MKTVHFFKIMWAAKQKDARHMKPIITIIILGQKIRNLVIGMILSSI